MAKVAKSKPARPRLFVIDFEKRRREAEQRETIQICREMHEQAARGEVKGVAIYWKDGHGEDHCIFTGPFEANPAEAANAAARMALLANELQGDL